MRDVSSTSLLAPFRRFTALGCAALVLGLLVFGASPGLHDELHDDHQHTEGSEVCAVTLFHAGVSVALECVNVDAPTFVSTVMLGGLGRTLDLAAPRYLRRPERGPPGRN